MGTMSLTTRLQKRYLSEGDELALEALKCIRQMEASLNALVSAVDSTERKHRPAIKNAQALLAKLRNK
jgi:hypothetical protein